MARFERSISQTGLKVLEALGKQGWSSQRHLGRVGVGGLSPPEIRKGLEELDRGGLVSSSFGRSTLTARGRRELHVRREQAYRARVRKGTARVHEVSLLTDAEVRAAVRRVKQRADRESNSERLLETFVDPGISEQLDNTNNQIIFGRRGTGKTHVLRVLHDVLAAMPRTVVVYVDLRTLGSSSVFEDETRPLSVRTTALTKDVFEPVHAALLERATAPDAGDVDFQALDGLAEAITRSILGDERRHEEELRSSQSRAGATIEARAAPPFLAIGASAGTEDHVTARRVREGNPLDHVLFSQIANALKRSLSALGVERLYLLFDEWTAVPEALQPYLAEFLKRSVFVVDAITVKIAALEYRSSFSLPTGRNNLVGFELGADVSSNLGLDDYFVYDRDDTRTEEVFAELLYRHLSAEIARRRESEHDHDADYLSAEYAIDAPERLVELLFVSRRPYQELVRAGEGVARDFIGIFSGAFSNAVRRNLRAIDLMAVRDSARDWFATDKEPNLDEHARTALDLICDEVISKGRRRTFLLERRYATNALLNSLVDFRVLHLIQRHIPDPENPTRRYNLYTLDYGLYVDLRGTKYELKAEFGSRQPRVSDDVVPVATRRYFRGVVLKPEQFEPG